MKKIPRILLAAVSSNSGKTAAACGMMSAYVQQGLNIRSCKCGPDYLFSVINTEDATLIYGGSEFSNWVCEMFGKLCHGLTQENGADVCGRVF